jgi:sugar lactone lactonase YvrE
MGIGALGITILVLALAIFSSSAPASESLPSASEVTQLQTAHFLFTLDQSADAFLSPMAVTTDAQGNIYVADTGHSVVKVYDRDGQFQRTIGRPARTQAAGDGEFIYPVGVALDNSGRLYVADVQAGRIATFNPDGTYAGIFGKGVITSPIGLLYHDGQLFVNDIGAQQVVALNAQGQVTQRWGGPGTLAYANYSAITPEGNLAVADSNNNRIAVFSTDGKISQTVGAVGTEPLLMPRGLAYDAKGRLYVATVFNHQIAVFDPALNLLYTYGQQGAASDQFNFPNGLWINGDRVYVTDRQNNRVQVWQIPDISQ